MLFWGVFFIALGVGALLNVQLWPIALIGLGCAMVLSIGFGRHRSNAWMMPACGFPAFWIRDDREYDRPAGETREDIV